MFEYMLLVTVTFTVVRWIIKKPQSLPGYDGIPILGILPFLGSNPAITFMEWSKKLGPVYRAKIGTRNAVVLNDYDSIQECLSQNWKFSSDRPNLGVLDAARRGHGLIFAKFGKAHREKKKIMTTSLKRFTSDGVELEENLHEEMKHLFKFINSQKGQSVFIKNSLESTFASIMCNVTFGKRLGWDNKMIKEILSAMHELMNSERDNMYVQFLVMCDWLKYIPPFSGAYKRYQINYKRQEDVMAEVIKERRNFHKSDGVIRDTIDLFLCRQELNPNNPAYKDVELNFILSDFFNAGIDTKVTYFMWCILYLVANDDVQEKIYAEIYENIGVDEIPRNYHRENMPFTQSFLDEIHRYRTITPLSLWRRLTGSVTVSDLKIPGGTTIIPNIWAVHHSSEYFDKPEEMIPDRFVDKTTGKFVKSPYIIPFGVGMRKCIGYKLAEKELFLTLCNILQNYKISEDPISPLPRFNDFLFGFVFTALPFKVCFIKR